MIIIGKILRKYACKNKGKIVMKQNFFKKLENYKETENRKVYNLIQNVECCSKHNKWEICKKQNFFVVQKKSE